MCRDPKITEEYQQKIKTQLELYKREATSNDTINQQWEKMKQIVKCVTEETIGFKPIVKRTGWYDAECKELIEQRNKARLTMLQRETRRTRQLYNEQEGQQNLQKEKTSLGKIKNNRDRRVGKRKRCEGNVPEDKAGKEWLPSKIPHV